MELEAGGVDLMPPQRDHNGRFIKKGAQPSAKPSSGKAGTTTDRDLGWKKFAASIRAAKGKQTVDVGFFLEEVAMYAAANEFGTAHIPSRPFMRSTVDKHRDKYLKMMQAAGLRVGPGLSPADALIPIANELRNDLINAIQTWRTPPNAASTVDKKGFDAPLVETGQMQRALTWRVGGGDKA